MELTEAIELGIKKLAKLNFEDHKFIPTLNVYIKLTNHLQIYRYVR